MFRGQQALGGRPTVELLSVVFGVGEVSKTRKTNLRTMIGLNTPEMITLSMIVVCLIVVCCFPGKDKNSD